MTAATTRQPSDSTQLALERIEHKLELVKQEFSVCKTLQENSNKLNLERILEQDKQHLEHLAQIRSEMQLRISVLEKAMESQKEQRKLDLDQHKLDLEEQKKQTEAIQEELKSLREVATQFRLLAGIGGGGGVIGLLVGIITLAKAFGGG